MTVVAWGPTVPIAQSAAQTAAESGISVELIDLVTLNPWDAHTVIESVKKTGRAVVVHEAARTGGFGAEVAATIQEEAFLSLEAPVARVTGYDTPFPVPSIEDFWIPDAARIVRAVREARAY